MEYLIIFFKFFALVIALLILWICYNELIERVINYFYRSEKNINNMVNSDLLLYDGYEHAHYSLYNERKIIYLSQSKPNWSDFAAQIMEFNIVNKQILIKTIERRFEHAGSDSCYYIKEGQVCTETISKEWAHPQLFGSLEEAIERHNKLINWHPVNNVLLELFIMKNSCPPFVESDIRKKAKEVIENIVLFSNQKIELFTNNHYKLNENEYGFNFDYVGDGEFFEKIKNEFLTKNEEIDKQLKYCDISNCIWVKNEILELIKEFKFPDVYPEFFLKQKNNSHNI